MDAKEKFAKESKAKEAAKVASQNALIDFKAYLLRLFGCTYHAWRRALDMDGTMNIRRVGLFESCRQLNWKGDVRALWKALDYNGSGSSTLEELDPNCAQLLAQFRVWALSTFGNKPSVPLWKALDRRSRRRLTCQQFAQELFRQGFDLKPKTLAKWLDWQPKRYLTEEDLQFLDVWRPPSYLVAKPSFEGANEIRRLMLKKYGNYVKAWRNCMDKDNSNNCNWHEFVAATKTLRFTGDIAGAWLALDEDVSGSISLGEIDKAANGILIQFKEWAIEEFGGVRSAFKTISTHIAGGEKKKESSDLSYKEFRLTLREFGFPGDANLLFDNLDQQGERRLGHKDVIFLDSWDLAEGPREDEEATVDQSSDNTKSELNYSILLEYGGDGPGPGAYSVSSSYSATARQRGAFSFTGRGRHVAWLKPPKGSVGPAYYEPEQAEGANKSVQQTPRKPAWGFGSANRNLLPEEEIENKDPRRPPAAGAQGLPGPGSYDPRAAMQGPQFSMGHRWGVKVHPLQTASGAGHATARQRSKSCW